MAHAPASGGAPWPEPSPWRALALITGASVAFVLLAATVKATSPTTGTAAPILARGLLGLAVCTACARRRGVPLRPRGWPMLGLRCGAGVLAVAAYYRALGPGGTDLATAAMLLKTSPLWVAVLAPAVLGERPRPRVAVALAVGLAGALLASLDPARGWTPDLARLGVGLSLLAGVLSALAYLALRGLARTDAPLTVVVWFSLALTLGAGPLAALDLVARGPWPPAVWGQLLLAGALGTAGQLLLTQAYRHGTAAAVTVGGLAEVGLHALVSVAWFAEVPSREAALGGLLALCAGVMAATAPPAPPAVAATGAEARGGLPCGRMEVDP